jgi:cysteine-rich repeat protein
MRSLIIYVGLGGLVLGAASCGGGSGVLVAAFWDSTLNVDALEVQDTLVGGAPSTQMLQAPTPGQPMTSPFRILVQSPSHKQIDVTVLGHVGARVAAEGRLTVTPGDHEYLQVGLHLESASPPRCGDGRLDAGEECDDGNREDRDGCTNACTCARCGDGILHAFDSATGAGSCTPDPVEACDDGNTASNDGCSATCQRE